MMFLSLWRVVKFAFQNFGRNLWLSLATMSILLLMLLSVNALVAVNVLGKVALSAVRSKVDVSVHFTPETDSARVDAVKVALLSLPEVQDVQFVSPEEAAENFKAQYQSDADILAALDEVEGNPFGPSLVVRARSLDGYPKILAALEDPIFANSIDGHDFDDRTTAIERIRFWAEGASLAMLALSAAFIVVACFVVYTTIRMSISTHREEIAVMRLVGAPNSFIRGPFYGEAVIWTIVSGLLTALILLPLLAFADPYLQRFFAGAAVVSLSGFYAANAFTVIGGQIAAVLLLTLLTTRIATAKYIKV